MTTVTKTSEGLQIINTDMEEVEGCQCAKWNKASLCVSVS